jgi:hypothetical protein
MKGHIIRISDGAKIDKNGKLVISKKYPSLAAAIAAKKKQTWRGTK